ncbi:MAG TPA: hypothetical protein ENN44_03260 [Methanoculleus sp.]|nr:hypothetical protein [Methanoculleus sp.]
MAVRILTGIMVTCTLNLGLLLYGIGEPGLIGYLYPLATAFLGGLIGSSEMTNYYHRLISWGRFRRFGKAGVVIGCVVALISTVLAIGFYSFHHPTLMEGVVPAAFIGEVFLFYLIPSVIGSALAAELMGEVKGYALDHRE